MEREAEIKRDHDAELETHCQVNRLMLRAHQCGKCTDGRVSRVHSASIHMTLLRIVSIHFYSVAFVAQPRAASDHDMLCRHLWPPKDESKSFW